MSRAGKMKNKLFKLLWSFSILFLFLIINSCSSVTYEKIYPILADGKYDSEFPYRRSSEELERISKTVHRVSSTGFYKTYSFSLSDSVTIEDIHKKLIENLAVETGFAHESKAGTATTIYHEKGRVALITCAHVVNFPDTVHSFISDSKGNVTRYLESVLIKDNQAIYVAGFPEGSKLKIIVIDEKLDVAIIGRNYYTLHNYIFPVFNYPIGSARELEWGTFVYLFGYPMNYQMITKALVSSPNRDDNGSFLLDAVVNRGFSGGIVLAIKDGLPNFELVGIVQWVPQEVDNIIAPMKRKSDQPYGSLVPYEGDIYVKSHPIIKYGIANIISIDSILEFLKLNKSKLYADGYYLDKYFGK